MSRERRIGRSVEKRPQSEGQPDDATAAVEDSSSGGPLYRVWRPPQSQDCQGAGQTDDPRITSSRLSSADCAACRALTRVTESLCEFVFDCAIKFAAIE